MGIVDRAGAVADGAVVPVARGDGIRPEIAAAPVRVLSAARATGPVGSADISARVARADSAPGLDRPGHSRGWGR